MCYGRCTNFHCGSRYRGMTEIKPQEIEHIHFTSYSITKVSDCPATWRHQITLLWRILILIACIEWLKLVIYWMTNQCTYYRNVIYHVQLFYIGIRQRNMHFLFFLHVVNAFHVRWYPFCPVLSVWQVLDMFKTSKGPHGINMSSGWTLLVRCYAVCPVLVWFFRFLCVQHPVGVLYVSVDVSSTCIVNGQLQDR